jgi:hypothetical protein
MAYKNKKLAKTIFISIQTKESFDARWNGMLVR